MSGNWGPTSKAKARCQNYAIFNKIAILPIFVKKLKKNTQKKWEI